MWQSADLLPFTSNQLQNNPNSNKFPSMLRIHASILLLPLDLFQTDIREVQTITFTVFKVLIENSVLAAAALSQSINTDANQIQVEFLPLNCSLE